MAEELFQELGHTAPLSRREAAELCNGLCNKNEYEILLAENPEGQVCGFLTLSESEIPGSVLHS